MDAFLRVFTEGDFDESYIDEIYSINQDKKFWINNKSSYPLAPITRLLLKDGELIGFAFF